MYCICMKKPDHDRSITNRISKMTFIFKLRFRSTRSTPMSVASVNQDLNDLIARSNSRSLYF